MSIKNFLLGSSSYQRFSYFCLPHIIYLIITIVLVVLILIFKDKLRNLSNKTKNIIRIVGFCIILSFHLIYRISYLYYGTFAFSKHLDLYFCYIIMYGILFSVIFKKRNVFKLFFPLVFTGPLMTCIFPSINYLYTFGFFHCFITHNFLIIYSTLIFIIYDFKLEKKDYVLSFLVSNFVMIIVFLINYIFGFSYNELDSLLKIDFYLMYVYDKFYYNYVYLIYEIILIFGIFVSFVYNKLANYY